MMTVVTKHFINRRRAEARNFHPTSPEKGWNKVAEGVVRRRCGC